MQLRVVGQSLGCPRGIPGWRQPRRRSSQGRAKTATCALKKPQHSPGGESSRRGKSERAVFWSRWRSGRHIAPERQAQQGRRHDPQGRKASRRRSAGTEKSSVAPRMHASPSSARFKIAYGYDTAPVRCKPPQKYDSPPDSLVTRGLWCCELNSGADYAAASCGCWRSRRRARRPFFSPPEDAPLALSPPTSSIIAIWAASPWRMPNFIILV